MLLHHLDKLASTQRYHIVAHASAPPKRVGIGRGRRREMGSIVVEVAVHKEANLVTGEISLWTDHLDSSSHR